MTDEEMDELDMQALVQYTLGDDFGFESLSEGPRQQRTLLTKLMDKKSTGLLRERLIARILGLVHNPKMHSTTDGVTTFDGVHPVTGICYEIKAEEHTTNNPDRKIQSGQLAGVGVFSTIVSQAHIDKLTLDNPMIAHGMFGDGRLLCLVTFRLGDSNGLERITRYALSEKSTEPRYAFSDWIDCPTLEIVYVADSWPDHMNLKYKKIMQAKWLAKALLAQQVVTPIAPNIVVPVVDSEALAKNHPMTQISNPCIEDLGPQQSLDFGDTQPIYLFDLSL